MSVYDVNVTIYTYEKYPAFYDSSKFLTSSWTKLKISRRFIIIIELEQQFSKFLHTGGYQVCSNIRRNMQPLSLGWLTWVHLVAGITATWKCITYTGGQRGSNKFSTWSTPLPFSTILISQNLLQHSHIIKALLPPNCCIIHQTPFQPSLLQRTQVPLKCCNRLLYASNFHRKRKGFIISYEMN